MSIELGRSSRGPRHRELSAGDEHVMERPHEMLRLGITLTQNVQLVLQEILVLHGHYLDFHFSIVASKVAALGEIRQQVRASSKNGDPCGSCMYYYCVSYRKDSVNDPGVTAANNDIF